jgi:hypothetical protein
LAQYPAKLLGEYAGHFPRRVKNFVEFINIMKSPRTDFEDILMSFDVISIFTVVPTGEALRLLSRHCYDEIRRLFCHILTSSFLWFNGQFYEQTDSVSMGPLSSPGSSWSTLKKWLWRGRLTGSLCWFR